MLPHMSALPLILSDKRASHGSSCLGKSTEKQRLGYGSEHMIPAADAYRVDASNSQQRPPWGCSEVAGLPRLAGGAGSAGRNRRQTTKSLEQLPPLLVPISRAAAVPRIAVPASRHLGDPSWPVSDRRLDARPQESARGRSATRSCRRCLIREWPLKILLRTEESVTCCRPAPPPRHRKRCVVPGVGTNNELGIIVPTLYYSIGFQPARFLQTGLCPN
jgi:hypothetical protein